jgi:hypothetical protein
VRARAAHATTKAATHLCAMLEAMRREFTASRALLLAQRMLIYAEDELAMSTMRISLRTAAEMPQPNRCAA